jgi:hypothetical protein
MNSSSISSINTANSPYSIAYQNCQNNIGQFDQDFHAIGNALQSGNLASAQSAIATFQQDLQASSPTSAQQPFGANNQANSAFRNLVNALQSGSMSGAQNAYSTLQTALHPATHGSHHHHGTGGATTFSSLINNLATKPGTTATSGA